VIIDLNLLTFLEENNIQTRVTFAGNVTRHPIYREYLQEFKIQIYYEKWIFIRSSSWNDY
jgi:hypothetical protein